MSWKTPQIEAAFIEGKKLGASHMIVAMDPTDGENYPVYVKYGVDPQEEFPVNGDYVDEVYSLTVPWTEQASKGRVWNVEKTAVPVRKHHWHEYAEILEEMLITSGYPKELLADIKEGCFSELN